MCLNNGIHVILQDRNQSYHTRNFEDIRPKPETKLQDAMINGDLDGTAKIITEGRHKMLKF